RGAGASYRYRDDAAPAGTVHYRLRQIDLDGSSEYSPELRVRAADARPLSLSPVSPQPVRSGEPMRVDIRADAGAQLRLVLRDMLGRPLRVLLDETLQGSTVRTLVIPTADLGAGTYFLQLQGAAAAALRRITVIR
ncbi:MAG: hypothetical protein RRA94_04470, partial [Bacteroidota bacterium]|nr:hypothetical protein [Bacteroidota bacterium]